MLSVCMFIVLGIKFRRWVKRKNICKQSFWNFWEDPQNDVLQQLGVIFEPGFELLAMLRRNKEYLELVLFLCVYVCFYGALNMEHSLARFE